MLKAGGGGRSGVGLFVKPTMTTIKHTQHSPRDHGE